MNRSRLFSPLALVLASLPVTARTSAAQGGCPGVVDAQLWTEETYVALPSTQPSGNWQITADGDFAAQTAFGQPTFLVSDFDLDSQAFECVLRTNPTGVGGAVIGFALGIEPGETTRPDAEYLLLDWRRNNDFRNWGGPSGCTPGTQRDRGLALARVFGTPTGDELWGHVNFDVDCSGPDDGVEELARGQHLGSEVWRFNTYYVFRIEYTRTHLRVFVDGALELDVSGEFPAGGIAFYTFNQGNIAFSAFLTRRIASSSPYGAGWPGAVGVPTLTLGAPPALGTAFDFLMGSSALSHQPGTLVVGTRQGNLPTPYGGRVLVRTPYILRQPFLALPAGQSSFSVVVPNDVTLCGLHVYAQLLQSDPAASHGYAASRGLELAFGE